MSYGPQAIQPEGWLFSITKENRSRPAKPCKSKRGPKKKERARSTCDHCGTRFEVERGAVGKYCSHDCMRESRLAARPSWYPCSKCLAQVGIGITLQSRLFRVSKATISRQWGKDGIKAQVPPDRSWKHYAASRAGLPIGQDCWWGTMEAAEAWMDGYNPRFPDWTGIWLKEKSKMDSRSKYNTPKAIYERASIHSIRQHCSLTIYPDWSPVWYSSRLSMSPKQKAVDNLRSRLRELMKTTRRGGSSSRSKFIGCSTSQLAAHLESQFTKRMNWQNYGTYWHVDHIIPCAAFDHTDPRQVAQCWHWTNLRPLEAKKNIAKRDLVTEPQMHLLLCATH